MANLPLFFVEEEAGEEFFLLPINMLMMCRIAKEGERQGEGCCRVLLTQIGSTFISGRDNINYCFSLMEDGNEGM